MLGSFFFVTFVTSCMSVVAEQYVLTGIISTEYAKMFAQLETLRDKADYNIMFVAKANDMATT